MLSLQRAQGAKILQALWCGQKNKSIIILKKRKRETKTENLWKQLLRKTGSMYTEKATWFTWDYYLKYFMWYWRRLLRVPWTERKSNQSILKEINSEYSLEGLLLKLSSNTLATWCKGLTHWKRPWCWARLRAGGEGGNRGWDDWMESLNRWTWIWENSRRWWRTGKPGVL